MKNYLKENKNRIIILFGAFIFQSLIYFITKLFQNNPVYLNNAIDDRIPFIPSFVIFYVMWYLFLILIPLLILKYNKKVFDKYIVVSIVYAILEGIIFILFPTTMNRQPLVVTDISTWIVDIIYKVDTPVCNLFPSAHCAFSILFIISILDVKEVKKEYKILIIISSLLIILSTVFIKQHVVVDVLGALLIVPIYYILRKRKINLEESGIYAKIFCQK
ncbi:MAG: phosphatase PAP2 family protein [Bacilli bacterium]